MGPRSLLLIILFQISFTLWGKLACAQLEFHSFHHEGKKYYAIVIGSGQPVPNDVVKRAQQNFEILRDVPIDFYDMREYNDINKILQGEFPLAESTDFKEALRSGQMNWQAYQENPSKSMYDYSQFVGSFKRMIVEYASYFKWKAYNNSSTMPKVLDKAVLTEASKLFGKGIVTAIFLDAQKNFVGMSAISYPTKQNPKLPVEQLVEHFQKKGDLSEDYRLPYLDNPEEIKRINTLPTTGDDGRPHHAPFLEQGGWRSISAELMSLAVKPGVQFEIMEWSIYFFEKARNFEVSNIAPFAINNGAEPQENRLPLDGQYLGSSSKIVFRLHRKMGWEKVGEVEDLVLMRLSRKDYLKSLERSMTNVSLKGASLKDSVSTVRRPKFGYFEKNRAEQIDLLGEILKKQIPTTLCHKVYKN